MAAIIGSMIDTADIELFTLICAVTHPEFRIFAQVSTLLSYPSLRTRVAITHIICRPQ